MYMLARVTPFPTFPFPKQLGTNLVKFIFSHATDLACRRSSQVSLILSLLPYLILIGELAPLLSVLGHQMHKRHKSACTPDLDACPDWDVRGRVICPSRFLSVSAISPHSP
jgi:hypothetical protein